MKPHDIDELYAEFRRIGQYDDQSRRELQEWLCNLIGSILQGTRPSLDLHHLREAMRDNLDDPNGWKFMRFNAITARGH